MIEMELRVEVQGEDMDGDPITYRYKWLVNKVPAPGATAPQFRTDGLKNGDRVRLRSEQGQIELPCQAAKSGELPSGVLFLPYGDMSSRLMGGDTHGTGMPNSKSFDVVLEKL